MRSKVFGESFDAGAIVGEVRQTEAEYFRDALITEFRAPGARNTSCQTPLPGLPATRVLEAYLAAQAKLWLGDASLDGAPGSDVWRVALATRLREHAMLRNVLARVSGAPRDLVELVADLARAVPAYREDQELGRRAITSFLSLVSMARAWREELPAATAAREAGGTARPTDAFLHVRVQLWQRELNRMVAEVGAKPRTWRFFDDLTNADDQSLAPLAGDPLPRLRRHGLGRHCGARRPLTASEIRTAHSLLRRVTSRGKRRRAVPVSESSAAIRTDKGDAVE